MYIYLLDNSLRLEVFYDETDHAFRDNICISIDEDCPEEEKLFRHDETNFYITPDQACALIQALKAAVAQAQQDRASSPCSQTDASDRV